MGNVKDNLSECVECGEFFWDLEDNLDTCPDCWDEEDIDNEE